MNFSKGGEKGKNKMKEGGFKNLKYALICSDYTQVSRLALVLSPFVLSCINLLHSANLKLIRQTGWNKYSLKLKKNLSLDFR